MGRRVRSKIEPTDDWELLLPLFEWPEQQAYEELRPLVLFHTSVAERARETGTPERTMYRRIERFERDGMESPFATDPAAARAKRWGLEPTIRRISGSFIHRSAWKKKWNSPKFVVAISEPRHAAAAAHLEGCRP